MNAQTHSKIKPSLGSIAAVFLLLGATAFGGPAAHIALMEQVLVHDRKWISRERFLDLLGATNLIPGPNSTEMAIHIGQTQAGLPGLLVAGVCFILPAALMVCALAALYVRFGNIPVAAAVLYGLKPVVIAIVAQALWRLSRVALPSLQSVVIAAVVAALAALGINEIALLFGPGLLAVLTRFRAEPFSKERGVVIALVSVSVAVIAFAVLLGAYAPKQLSFSLPALFLYFLKVGSVLYGSGYVLLAFLRTDLVEHYHWITSAQLLDATAVGQFTPGPVFTTATFIGYLLAGLPGALVATIGIFLPAFILVALTAPLIEKMRESKVAGWFLDAVNAAAIALMAVVTFQLGQAALVDWLTIALALVSLVILVRTKVNSAWLMVAGAICGLAYKVITGQTT